MSYIDERQIFLSFSNAKDSKEIHYAGNGKKVTYADYAEEQKQVISYDEMIVWAKANFPEKEDFYILESPSNCIENIPDEAKAVFQVCYQTEGETARGENYTLYRVMVE